MTTRAYVAFKARMRPGDKLYRIHADVLRIGPTLASLGLHFRYTNEGRTVHVIVPQSLSLEFNVFRFAIKSRNYHK